MDINSLERGNKILKDLNKIKAEREVFIEHYNRHKDIYLTFDRSTVFCPDSEEDKTLLRHKIYDFMINVYTSKITKLEEEFASL